ncbi:MAG TPA: biotin transporter BioY [Chloroflexota bacterium]|nr:biotin transporter BioY [Chloroflexota bacterium]
MLNPVYVRMRNLTSVALFAALTVALGGVYIPLPWSPIPITGQTLGAMLAVGVLGARRGLQSMLVVMVLVAVGLPVLAGGRGGLGVFVGPTAGYLIAWPIVALFIGWVVERIPFGKSSLPLLMATNIAGAFLIYVPGVLWMSYVTSVPIQQAVVAGVIPFIPGDMVKALAATMATFALWRTSDPRATARTALATHL